MQEIIIWWIYKHFKGHKIEILNIAIHTETEEELVIYKHLSDPLDNTNEGKIRARPKEMFLEEVTREGKTFPRFILISKS